MSNPFLINHGPFLISNILSNLKLNYDKSKKDYEIYDIKDLLSATNKDIFFSFKKIFKPLQKILKLHFV